MSSHGLIVDLNAEATGSGGAVWSLPHGGDLDANLVRLDPGGGVGEHVNNELDVLIVALSGSGKVVIDGNVSSLGPNHLALIPQGTSRSIVAGDSGITYVSVHRRRGPLAITNHKPKLA